MNVHLCLRHLILGIYFRISLLEGLSRAHGKWVDWAGIILRWPLPPDVTPVISYMAKGRWSGCAWSNHRSPLKTEFSLACGKEEVRDIPGLRRTDFHLLSLAWGWYGTWGTRVPLEARPLARKPERTSGQQAQRTEFSQQPHELRSRFFPRVAFWNPKQRPSWACPDFWPRELKDNKWVLSCYICGSCYGSNRKLIQPCSEDWWGLWYTGDACAT